MAYKVEAVVSRQATDPKSGHPTLMQMGIPEEGLPKLPRLTENDAQTVGRRHDVDGMEGERIWCRCSMQGHLQSGRRWSIGARR